MDPFLITAGIILLISGIVMTATIIIIRKKGRSIRWYGFSIIVLTSIALGIHFGLNVMNDLLLGLVIAGIFTLVVGFQWFVILIIREKIHGKRD